MASAPTPLEPGHFFGVNHTERRTGGLILSETHYRPAMTVPKHLHQRAYFGFLLGGGYNEVFGARQVTFSPLSVVFHAPREVRSGEISTDGARLFHVEVPDAWMERLRELGALIPDGAIDAQRGPLVTHARTLYREFRQPDTASAMVIEGVALEMLADLVRARPERGAAPPWLARARERLHAGGASDLSEVAADAGVSPVRLSRAFRRVYGEGPGEYLRRERIRRACVLLSDPARSLSAVAAELGFADQSHFTRVFRRMVGISPGAWRRERR